MHPSHTGLSSGLLPKKKPESNPQPKVSWHTASSRNAVYQLMNVKGAIRYFLIGLGVYLNVLGWVSGTPICHWYLVPGTPAPSIETNEKVSHGTFSFAEFPGLGFHQIGF